MSYTVVRTLQNNTVSSTKTNQPVLFREIVAVCSENHTFVEQNVEFFNVKRGGMGSNNWALKVLKKTNVEAGWMGWVRSRSEADNSECVVVR